MPYNSLIWSAGRFQLVSRLRSLVDRLALPVRAAAVESAGTGQSCRWACFVVGLAGLAFVGQDDGFEFAVLVAAQRQEH